MNSAALHLPGDVYGVVKIFLYGIRREVFVSLVALARRGDVPRIVLAPSIRAPLDLLVMIQIGIDRLRTAFLVSDVEPDSSALQGQWVKDRLIHEVRQPQSPKDKRYLPESLEHGPRVKEPA